MSFWRNDIFWEVPWNQKLLLIFDFLYLCVCVREGERVFNQHNSKTNNSRKFKFRFLDFNHMEVLNEIFYENWVGLGYWFKDNCPLLRLGHSGGVPSVRVFLRNLWKLDNYLCRRIGKIIINLMVSGWNFFMVHFLNDCTALKIMKRNICSKTFFLQNRL